MDPRTPRPGPCDARTGRMAAALVLFLCLATPPSPAPAAGPALRLTTDEVYPRSTPRGDGFEDIILRKAFGALGIVVSSTYLPSERALINVNEGVDDGIFARVAGLEKTYPNFVMVPVKICDFSFSVFTKDPQLAFSDWASLAPYNVGLVRGWKYPEARLPRTRSLVSVRDDEALFELLDKGRVDLVIHDFDAGRVMVKDRGYAGIVALAPPLARTEMFLYLNRRHADLVPPLARVLGEMHANGTIQGIIGSVLRKAGVQ